MSFAIANWKPSSAGIFKALGWVGVGFATVIVTTGLFLLYAGNEQWQRVLPILTSCFAAAAVFLTLAGHLFAQAKDAAEREDKRSVFYLESSLTAYTEAQALLEDDNNDRITWIAAARALGHADDLSKRITQKPHLQTFELHQLKYRRFFHERLLKTAAFFYGVTDHSMPLKEAAAASTASTTRAGLFVSSTATSIPSSAIYAVWRAAQWPASFQDPLDEADFTAKEEARLMVLFPGVHDYLEHTRVFMSASGTVYPRNAPDAP
jgi:hypothetical protein